MPSILVTGGSGFLGAATMATLSQAGEDVTTMGRVSVGHAYRHIPFDARVDLRRLASILEDIRPSAIIHLAGAPSDAAPAEAYLVNSAFFAEIVAAARRSAAIRIVAVGSAAEYGATFLQEPIVTEAHPCRPATTYGVTKHAQTLESLAARRAGQRTTIARMFNLVGPGMPHHLALGRFVKVMMAARRGDTLRLQTGSLEKRRDFVDVNFAARVLVGLITQTDEPSPIINVCTGQSSTIRQWAEALARHAGITFEPVLDPALIRDHDPDDARGSPETLRIHGLDPDPVDVDSLTERIWSGRMER